MAAFTPVPAVQANHCLAYRRNSALFWREWCEDCDERIDGWRGRAMKCVQACERCSKCKWGRHCCRPHSHQRVVFSTGEPFKKRLAPDVSSPNGLGACCHRRSRRHPVLPFGRFCSSWPKPVKAVPTFRLYRDHSPFDGCFSPSGFRRSDFHLSICNQVPGLSGGSAIAFFSNNCLASSLHLLQIQSQRPRGQSPPSRLF